MIRAAPYARFSSDLQSPTSNEDQLRLCGEHGAREKWSMVKPYFDEEISGWSMVTRPGVQKLMQDALAGKFDIVVAEALDRLSRDQADIATIYKRLTFAGIRIFTLAEGWITELQIGFKGTMNAVFLKDLAKKTHRGLRGRIEKGKSGGGVSYGYDVVRKFDAEGAPIRGDRIINEDEARIVRRIFQEYAASKSPKAIAHQLNRENVPAPRTSAWAATTINGHRRRGSGILNNDLYIGMLVWNRLSFPKNPATGKRVPRFNPESEWIRKNVPELRILDQELWEKAKARQIAVERKGLEFHEKQRPRKLFSYLLKCGCCGGGFSMISSERYGCSSARNKGTCSSRITIRQDTVEQAVLNALQNHLMDPKMVSVFCEEYTRHLNRMRIERNAALRSHEAELERVGRERDKLVQSIKDGVPGALVKDDLIRVCARQDELKQIIESTEESPVLIHPRMADRYKKEVTALREALNDESNRTEAADLLRALIEKIVLTPKAGKKKLTIDLYGDLAGILSIASNRPKAEIQAGLALQYPDNNTQPSTEQDKMAERTGSKLVLLDQIIKQDKLVAGAGFEPATFGL